MCMHITLLNYSNELIDTFKICTQGIGPLAPPHGMALIMGIWVYIIVLIFRSKLIELHLA